MNKKALIGKLIIILILLAFVAGVYFTFKFKDKITAAATKAEDIADEVRETKENIKDFSFEIEEPEIEISNITESNNSAEFTNLSNSSYS